MPIRGRLADPNISQCPTVPLPHCPRSMCPFALCPFSKLSLRWHEICFNNVFTSTSALCVGTFPLPTSATPIPTPLTPPSSFLSPVSCSPVFSAFFLLFLHCLRFFFTFRASAMILEFCVQVPPTFRKQSKNGFFFQFSSCVCVGECVFALILEIPQTKSIKKTK